MVVFTTVALGGFRGIAIDILWARICMLQDEGEYIEIAQLSELITKLNPRLPIVWDYHSHNMAYNIASMASTPQDRWRWIGAGISMLRDEALAYNPGSGDLRERLCRIYTHKMIDYTDPGRQFYRIAWATEMAAALEKGAGGGTGNRWSGVKLDRSVMDGIDKTFGPLDWRLPEAYVLYWATLGGKAAGDTVQKSLDVMICGAMVETLLNGRIVDFRPADQVLTTDVLDDALPRTIATFKSTAARHDFSLVDDIGFGSFYRRALRRAVVVLTEKQHMAQAEAIFGILRDELHDKGTDLPLADYVAALASPQPPTASP